jgi:hypothetical protein
VMSHHCSLRSRDWSRTGVGLQPPFQSPRRTISLDESYQRPVLRVDLRITMLRVSKMPRLRAAPFAHYRQCTDGGGTLSCVRSERKWTILSALARESLMGLDSGRGKPGR